MVQVRAQRSGALLAVMLLIAGLVVGTVAVFALANAVADEEPVVTPSPPGRVSDADYAAVARGMSKSDVEHLLLPATAVSVAALDEYEVREPETPSASCVYYESGGGTADDLYRFCYDGDRLVDKTVILAPEDGVTGGP